MFCSVATRVMWVDPKGTLIHVPVVFFPILLSQQQSSLPWVVFLREGFDSPGEKKVAMV